MVDNTPAPLDFLDSQQAADLVHVKPRRMADAAWREKYGVPSLKIGGRVQFERAQLLAWVRRCREREVAA